METPKSESERAVASTILSNYLNQEGENEAMVFYLNTAKKGSTHGLMEIDGEGFYFGALTNVNGQYYSTDINIGAEKQDGYPNWNRLRMTDRTICYSAETIFNGWRILHQVRLR